ARMAQWEAVSADFGEHPGIDAVRLAEPCEMLAQTGALGLPAADSQVDVVALREDPAVAAGYGAELEHEPARVPLGVDALVREVPLERSPVLAVGAQAERPRRDAVRAVRADDDLRGVVGDPVLAHLRHAHALAELGAGGDGLLDEVRVEPPTLGH